MRNTSVPTTHYATSRGLDAYIPRRIIECSRGPSARNVICLTPAVLTNRKLHRYSGMVVATENRIRDGADAAIGYPRFAMLDYRLCPSVRQAAVVFKPETLGALASERVPSVLALEVAPSCRPARGPGRHPRFDPDNQPRQPAVGCATYPWRTAETWHRHRPVDGRQVHVTASRPSLSGRCAFSYQTIASWMCDCSRCAVPISL